MDIGNQILSIRKEQKLTQEEFGRLFYVTRQTVSNWENDNIQPSIEMLIKLSNVFNISTDYLLGLTPTNSINVDGLPIEFVSHIVQIIDDYRAR